MAIATVETPSAGLTPRASQDVGPWAGAIRQRRRALLQRLGMAAASALIFSPLLGWTVGATWVAGYFAIQLLDMWVFGPVNDGKVERLTGFRRAAGWVMLMANSGYFGSLSILLWTAGGPMGGICAAMLLSAGAIYSMINAPQARSVLILTVAPQFAYLALLPVFMALYGASAGFVTAAAIAVGVFATYCLSTWQRMNQARVAETAARIEAQAKQADAERIMAGRSAFLATIGHDLRTPISAILAGAAELERGAGDAAGRSQARLITDAGVMMKALLDDLLDHAKLDAGHLTIETVDFDLRHLLNQTLRLWRGPVRAKGLKLRIEGAARVPTWVQGDPMRLRQVLNNLISNALKFTSEGAITLRLDAWALEPTGHAVLIEVADTGPGMTPAQMVRLFRAFDQTAEGISARHGGTGLGLSISRQLVELMGGRLTARSQPGQGARFTLALTLQPGVGAVRAPEAAVSDRVLVPRPLDAPRVIPTTVLVSDAPSVPVPVAVQAPTPVQQVGPTLELEPIFADIADASPEEEERPLRVLVVDDHDINRRAIQLILQPLGCDIATAADGMIALRICETSAFDLIFMDVRMPELDGRETTRRIRAGDGPNAAVPIIAVTADTAQEDIDACTDAGMTYFVPKPISPQALLDAINHVLVDARDEAAEKPEAATVAA